MAGGVNVPVVGVGGRGLLQVEGVIGGGELVPAATAGWFYDDGNCGLGSATGIDDFGSW